MEIGLASFPPFTSLPIVSQVIQGEGFWNNPMLQLCQINIIPIVNNPFVTGVILREQNLFLNTASFMSKNHVFYKV